jgi:transposase
MVDGIIKQDSHGRMRTTRERREALLAEYDRSAMTGRKFAKWAGIKYTTFANWLQARRKLGCRELAAPMAEHTTGTRWLEAVVEGSPRKEPAKSKTATLIVYGPSGVRLEITEAKQVGLAAQLLRELDGKGRC